MTTYKYFEVNPDHARQVYLGGGCTVVYAPVMLSESVPSGDRVPDKRLVWAAWGCDSFAVYNEEPFIQEDDSDNTLYVKDLGSIELLVDMSPISDESVDDEVFELCEAFDGWDDVAAIMYHLYRGYIEQLGYLGNNYEGIEL